MLKRTILAAALLLPLASNAQTYGTSTYDGIKINPPGVANGYHFPALDLPYTPGNRFYLDNLTGSLPMPSVAHLGDRATMGCTNTDNMGGGPGATFSWAAAAPYVNSYFERDAALSVCSPSGVAITGISRTSDTTPGFPRKSAFAFNGFAVADTPSSVAEGMYLEVWSRGNYSGTYGTPNYIAPSSGYLMEGDAVNTTGPVVTNGYQLNPAGGAYGVMVGAGGDPGNGATVFPSQFGLGCISNKTTWDHCLIVGHGAMTRNTVGIADPILLTQGDQIGWDFDYTGVHSAFIRSDGTAAGLGLVFNNNGATIQNAAGAVVATFSPPSTGTPNGGFSVGGQIYASNIVTSSLYVAGPISSTIAVTTPELFISNSATPPSSTSSCVTGAIEWDANFTYVCIATNSWKRAALSTF